MSKFSGPRTALWHLFFSLMLVMILCLHLWKVLPLYPLAVWENLFYDGRMAWSQVDGVDNRVVVVAIDEASLQELGRWPWSRNHLAKLVSHLVDYYRVAALAMDMVFPEPDHSSGLQVLESLADGELKNEASFQNRMSQLRLTLAYDHLLAQSMQGKPVVLGFHLNNDTKQNNDPRQKLPKPILDLWEIGYTQTTIPQTQNYIGNLEILQNAALSGGFFSLLSLDSDGVVRRLPLLYRYQDRIYPSLALATVQVLLGNPATTIGFINNRPPPGTPLVPQWIDVGNYRIAMDVDGSVLAPFRSSKTPFRQVSAVDILKKSLPMSALTGTVALLGTTAMGVGDRVATPLARDVAGVEVHANLISGILDNRLKERSERLLWLDTAILVAVAGLMILVATASTTWNILFALLSAALVVAVNVLAWEKIQLVLSLGLPLLIIISILVINLFFQRIVKQPLKESPHPPLAEEKTTEEHQETDSFWDDPPEAWRLDTSKLIIKESPKDLD